MTETATTRVPRVTMGQAVGQAEAVLTQLLARVLAQTGTRRQDYLAMQRLTALGGTATREAYIEDLGSWLQLDLWAAGELADALTQSGVLEQEDGLVRFGDRGAGLRDQIAGSGGAVTRSLVAPLDPRDVDTTIRILQEVTQRGRALLAAGEGESA